MIRVQREDFDPGRELEALTAGNHKVGGLAVFIGLVRDMVQDEAVGAMTLEHYPGMTEKSLGKIVETAQQRWEILDVAIIHRIGELKPADQIVLVSVASAHRKAAFAACEFIMDYLKTDAPFWKKETNEQGESWVEAKQSDNEARENW